jgi:hypothetical protein
LDNQTDEIRFQPIKEARTGYFVEYYPPVSGERFANLYLIFLEKPEPNAVCKAMEHEFIHWVNRYPLPIMASSFDEAGDLYYLEKEKGCNHLIGYVASDGSIKKHWQLIKDEELPEKALDTNYLMTLYKGVPFSRQSEKKVAWEKRVRKIQAGWYIVFVWAVVVPAIIALLGYANPVFIQGGRGQLNQPIVPMWQGGPIDYFTISPALPTGVSFNSSTGIFGVFLVAE